MPKPGEITWPVGRYLVVRKCYFPRSPGADPEILDPEEGRIEILSDQAPSLQPEGAFLEPLDEQARENLAKLVRMRAKRDELRASRIRATDAAMQAAYDPALEPTDAELAEMADAEPEQRRRPGRPRAQTAVDQE